MSPKKSLPKELFAYIEEGDGDPYVVAVEDIEDTVYRQDPKRVVGIYELRETGTVSLEIKTDLATD